MALFLVLFATAALATANFIPPYYGSNYADNHDNLANHWGSYGRNNEGYGSGYEGQNYGHAVGDRGYNVAGYGSHGHADGHSYYDNAGAKGHEDTVYDHGARAAADAEGMKKYSYFTSGSGPEGSYSKGYYGSEGYDHEMSNSKQAAGASGSGYKKGYEATESDHSADHSAYDKAAASHSGFGKQHDISTYGSEKAGYANGGHSDGWHNAAHDVVHSAHKPY
uniref:Fibroin heavy chain-like n=1 Tax=Heterorhabditis bacteriophora TaxID=37862 RepID=A0A1I7X0H2_HETBA